jgi:hypothetical protein
MTLSFTLNGVKQNIIPQGGNYSLNYPCSSKTTCYPYESEFPPGNYSFNVYGAGGGSYINGYDSPGGFSTGVVVLKQKTRLYFYVGAKGLCSSTTSTQIAAVFGGGGSGFNGAVCYSCSGGGASDVRVLQNTINNRIIVAGGAGGTGYYNKYMYGGKGGGSSGTKGGDYNSGSSSDIGGSPGTQTSGGASKYQVGIFGYGGNKTYANGCGGGGGWYGGGAGGPGCSAGGGGSGFVFTQLNSLVYLNSSFLLLSGRTETDTGNNIGDGRIIIEVLGTITNEIKIRGTCNCRNIFVPQLLHFFPFIVS